MCFLCAFQLRMSTPWLSTIERADEMKEKQVLARVFSDLNLDARCHFVRAKTWHQQTLSGQVRFLSCYITILQICQS